MEDKSANNERESLKIQVSREWTSQERSKLASLLDKDIETLNSEEQKLRERILYEAPCFQDIARKREHLCRIRNYAKVMPAAFLEINRFNYEGYIQKT
ncbi:MAG: hypothetical protein Q7S27_04545 [Nanoarchaeota archaeon]|nr:hypothetical protein [Nanoarchaeota archaeon]